MQHDKLCRFQHMAVATDLEDSLGCDCPLINEVRERIAWEIESLGVPFMIPEDAASIARGEQ